MIEIINQTSPIDEPAQFHEILLSIEDFFHEWARRSDLPSPENEFSPVLLLNALDFDEQTGGPEVDDELVDKPATEYLGVYQRRRRGCNFTARILLCPERIMSCVHDDPNEYRVLFAKVLVHELAHSAMDYCMDSRSFVGELIGYKFVEESLANLITLIAIEKKFTEWLPYARNFVSSQPWNYRFGGTLYDFAYLDFDAAILLVNAWRKRKLVYCHEIEYLLAATEVRSGNVMQGLGMLGAISVEWNNTYEQLRPQVTIY